VPSLTSPAPRASEGEERREGGMGKTLEEEYLAEYFVELKEKAKELA
jgi:hypothetical protein